MICEPKITSCDFTTFFSFLTRTNFFFIDVINKYYCKSVSKIIMNHFDAVDLSECRSEDVMFLLTLTCSV